MNNDYPSYKVSFHGNQHCLWIGKCWVEEGWVCSFWVNTRVSLCSSVASLLIGECWSLPLVGLVLVLPCSLGLPLTLFRGLPGFLGLSSDLS